MYRVGKNDTLSSIAEAHLGRASRWRQIYGMNQHELQNADRLQVGLELRLPRDATQTALVSQPRILR
jgi:nucleoid-associated protein YgaU